MALLIFQAPLSRALPLQYHHYCEAQATVRPDVSTQLMLLPSGEGGKAAPAARRERMAGGALPIPGEPQPGASWDEAGFGTQLLHQLLPLGSQRLASPPSLIHAGAFRGERALPPLPEAAPRLLQGFQRRRREKGRLWRQMKGKRWWEKGGQGLSLHGDEGKQMNPVSCTAAASPRPRQPC